MIEKQSAAENNVDRLGQRSLGEANKESIKELLSNYRSIFALTAAGLFFSLSVYDKKGHPLDCEPLFWWGIGFGCASLVSSLFLFFQAITRIYRGDAGIIYKCDIVALSILSFFCFLIGAVLLVLGI